MPTRERALREREKKAQQCGALGPIQGGGGRHSQAMAARDASRAAVPSYPPGYFSEYVQQFNWPPMFEMRTQVDGRGFIVKEGDGAKWTRSPHEALARVTGRAAEVTPFNRRDMQPVGFIGQLPRRMQ